MINTVHKLVDYWAMMGAIFCCRRWLLGLLVLQSTSSMVLDMYQDLLRNHLVITLFLTMLVGAGGNAGNQSAIKVIRGLVSHHKSCKSGSAFKQAQCCLLSVMACHDLWHGSQSMTGINDAGHWKDKGDRRIPQADTPAAAWCRGASCCRSVR